MSKIWASSCTRFFFCKTVVEKARLEVNFEREAARVRQISGALANFVSYSWLPSLVSGLRMESAHPQVVCPGPLPCAHQQKIG